MKFYIILTIFSFTLALSTSTASAQTQGFTYRGEDYALELPSTLWRAIKRPDGVHQHIDFIYRKDSDGHLYIRLEVVDRGVTTQQLALRDEERKLRFLPGYIENKEAPFAGHLKGTKLVYQYTRGGQPMTGRAYYLRADNNMVYILRFAGTRAGLERLRAQADFIARSFRLR